MVEETGFEGTETESGIKRLDEMASSLAQVTDEIRTLEEQLKAKRQREQAISQVEIPDLMDELGMESFRTTSGFTVTVKKELRHSLSKERKDEALDWLEKNGHGDIIKNLVAVQFVKGEESQAKALLARLEGEFHEKVQDSRDVHSSTLKSVLKLMLAEGRDFPMELFGAFEQRVAKIEVSRK